MEISVVIDNKVIMEKEFNKKVILKNMVKVASCCGILLVGKEAIKFFRQNSLQVMACSDCLEMLIDAFIEEAKLPDASIKSIENILYGIELSSNTVVNAWREIMLDMCK